MESFLKEVKTTKKVQNNIDKFESLTLDDDRGRSMSNSNAKKRKATIEVNIETEPVPLLTAVSSKPVTKASGSNIEHDPLKLRQIVLAPQHKRKDSAVFLQKDYLKDSAPTTLADDAREILKTQPDIEDIEAVLTYIQYGIDGQHDFNIRTTAPKSSLLIRVLVSTTIPDLWPTLTTSHHDRSRNCMQKTLLQALTSVAGIEALLEQLRTFNTSSLGANSENLRVYVDLLAQILQGSDTTLGFLRDVTKLYEKDVQRRLFWQGVMSLLAGSKILSTCASLSKGVAVAGADSSTPDWLTQGVEYSRWLGRDIVKAAVELDPQDTLSWSNLSQLLKRGLSLGYRDALVTTIYDSLLFKQKALWSPLHLLIKNQHTYDQKIIFDCILSGLVRSYFASTQHLAPSTTDFATTKAIVGAAALINGLIGHNEYLLECAIDWVSTSSGSNGRGLGMRRALISVLAQSQGNLERVLERALTSFSDKLQIQHAATAQQEHLAQTILLVIGYLHRQSPTSLKAGLIPTLIMNAVSNRLASSVPRTRLLGMIVGVGMSQCVDEPGRVMDFHVEEMETDEVKELLALNRTMDRIGELEDLKSLADASPIKAKGSKRHKTVAPNQPKAKNSETTSKIMAIEEVSTSSDDEDDLVPYQKPNDDPEDSDEDPTLINRDKPKQPIYIVDLIKQLQSASDKMDIVSMALKTAPSLIRRKAGFGTELSDNVHGLAQALINLQDGLSKQEHQQQKQDALIACMVSQPAAMGKYLTSTYFDGDFSLSQRSTLLVSIGLGARELAGYSDSQNNQKLSDIDMFPSQRLPPHLQPKPLTSGEPTSSKQLKGISNPISLLTNTVTQATIRPMALAAAESQASSGPEILKVTRTSSHLSVAKDKQSTQKSPKNILRNLHNILTNSIYLPLSSPLTAILSYTSTSSGSRVNTTLLDPSILCLHLQTLTLLLHTLGPTGLSAPSTFASITHETLSLLTALHYNTHRALDGVVLPAMLGLFLALIDITTEIGVTAQERLLDEPFGMVVSELVRWVSGLEGSGRAPPASDENERGGEGVAWTVLAAGIQVRWWEMGRRFQGRMLSLDMED